jgi:hypothetical protein
MYSRKYNSDYLVGQFWSQANTTNELPLAFPRSAYFVVPDIDFLQHIQAPFFSYIEQRNSLRSKSFTRHSLLAIFVTNSLSYALIPMRLLWPLVVRFIVDERRHSLFQVSSRFLSEIRWPEDFVSVKHSSSDRNCTQGRTEEGKRKRKIGPRIGHEGLRGENICVAPLFP